jgi:hypothetical protein
MLELSVALLFLLSVFIFCAHTFEALGGKSGYDPRSGSAGPREPDLKATKDEVTWY